MNNITHLLHKVDHCMKEVKRQAKDKKDNALSFEGKVLKGYYVRPYANGAQKSKVSNIIIIMYYGKVINKYDNFSLTIFL